MMLQTTSQKLVNEMVRINKEQSRTSCNVATLIDALFNIRDEENDFANLFYIYFEKQLKIKTDVIDSAISQLDGKSENVTSSKITFEIDEEGGTIEIESDEELKKVICSVDKLIAENDKKYVIPDYFMVALFESESQTMRRFLKKINATIWRQKRSSREKKSLVTKLYLLNLAVLLSTKTLTTRT